MISVNWWDHIRGRWATLRPYVSAHYGAARCATLFSLNQKVFFTFVMYDKQPKFMRAIGPLLSHWDAVNIKGMLEKRKGAPPFTPGEQRLSDQSLDVIRDASLWQGGDVCALFPVGFNWNPQTWLMSSSAQKKRRLAPNPSLSPDATWSVKNRDSILDAVQKASNLQRAQRAQIQKEMDDHLPRFFEKILDDKETFLPRFLLMCTLVTAAWIRRNKAETNWWGDEGPVTDRTGLLHHWGPFHVETPNNAGYGPLWVSAQLRMVLTMIASTWLRFGGIFQYQGMAFPDLVDTKQVEKFVTSLIGTVRTFMDDTIIPRWNQVSVKQQLYPEDSKAFTTNLFDTTKLKNFRTTLSMETFARYFLVGLVGQWDKVPTTALMVPFGAKDSVKNGYVLNASEAYTGILALSDAMNTTVKAIENSMSIADEVWTLHDELVTLEPFTLLPELPAPADRIVKVVPLPSAGRGTELERARIAATHALRLMEDGSW